EKAVEALNKGDANEALKRQEKNALDLDRLAADLDRAARLSRDPRDAARQLAKLQDGLKEQLASETNKKDDKTPLKERLEELGKEQKALAEAARSLSVPPDNKNALQARQKAADAASKAADALKKQDADQARKNMDEARRSLQRLSYELPDL